MVYIISTTWQNTKGGRVTEKEDAADKTKALEMIGNALDDSRLIEVKIWPRSLYDENITGPKS